MGFNSGFKVLILTLGAGERSASLSGRLIHGKRVLGTHQTAGGLIPTVPLYVSE